jgi:hypothetical protein
MSSGKDKPIDMTPNEIIDKYFKNTSRDDFVKLLEHHQTGQKERRRLTASLKFETKLNKKLTLRILELSERNKHLQEIVDDIDTDDTDDTNDTDDTDDENNSNEDTSDYFKRNK